MKEFNPTQRNSHIILASRVDPSDYISYVHDKIVEATRPAVEDSLNLQHPHSDYPLIQSHTSLLSESHMDTLMIPGDDHTIYVLNMSTCGNTRPEKAIVAIIDNMFPMMLHSLYLHKQGIKPSFSFPMDEYMKLNRGISKSVSRHQACFSAGENYFAFGYSLGDYTNLHIPCFTGNLSMHFRLADDDKNKEFFVMPVVEKNREVADLLGFTHYDSVEHIFPISEGCEFPGESSFITCYDPYVPIRSNVAYHTSPLEGVIHFDIDMFSFNPIEFDFSLAGEKLMDLFAIEKVEFHLVMSYVYANSPVMKVKYSKDMPIHKTYTETEFELSYS